MSGFRSARVHMNDGHDCYSFFHGKFAFEIRRQCPCCCTYVDRQAEGNSNVSTFLRYDNFIQGCQVNQRSGNHSNTSQSRTQEPRNVH
jgi:hypothetical protein